MTTQNNIQQCGKDMGWAVKHRAAWSQKTPHTGAAVPGSQCVHVKKPGLTLTLHMGRKCPLASEHRNLGLLKLRRREDTRFREKKWRWGRG